MSRVGLLTYLKQHRAPKDTPFISFKSHFKFKKYISPYLLVFLNKLWVIYSTSTPARLIASKEQNFGLQFFNSSRLSFFRSYKNDLPPVSRDILEAALILCWSKVLLFFGLYEFLETNVEGVCEFIIKLMLFSCIKNFKPLTPVLPPTNLVSELSNS